MRENSRSGTLRIGEKGTMQAGSPKLGQIWCHRASYDEAISLCKRTGVERNQNPHSDFPCISGGTGLYLRNSKSGAKSWPTPKGVGQRAFCPVKNVK